MTLLLADRRPGIAVVIRRYSRPALALNVLVKVRPAGHWLWLGRPLLATGYRGLLDRFPMFLDAITKLEIYRTS